MTDQVESPESIQRQIYANYYISIFSFTLLYYDYFLTLPLEVSRFWRYRRLTWASLFFYTNRYLSVFGHVPVVVEFFWVSDIANKAEMYVIYAFVVTGNTLNNPRCHTIQSYHQYLAFLTQIIISVMLIMRTYALYERNRLILCSMVVITCGAIGNGCWAIITGKGGSIDSGPTPHIGCPVALSKDSATRLAIAWSGMLVFDAMVFSLTLYKALIFRRVGIIKLLSVLLRDGTVYFGVMVAVNIANILTFILGGSRSRGILTTFMNIISSTMISRLMLNIRNPELIQSTAQSTTLAPPVVSTLMAYDTRFGGARTSSELYTQDDVELAIRPAR